MIQKNDSFNNFQPNIDSGSTSNILIDINEVLPCSSKNVIQSNIKTNVSRSIIKPAVLEKTVTNTTKSNKSNPSKSPIQPLKSRKLRSFKDDMSQIDPVLNDELNNPIIVRMFGIHIRCSDILRLNSNQLLNDNLVDFYLNLLCYKKSEKSEIKYFSMSSFYFTSYFDSIKNPSIQKLKETSNWLSNKSLFDYALILVPICHKMHWSLLTIDPKANTLRHYDSNQSNCLKETKLFFDHCLDLINNESKKSSKIFTRKNWKCESLSGIPQQTNGVDCGVFLCQYAKLILESSNFDFNQSQIPKIRLEMEAEIKSFDLQAIKSSEND